MYFTLGSFPISELIGFGDTAYRGIGTSFQSPAQNTPPAVGGNYMKTLREEIFNTQDELIIQTNEKGIHINKNRLQEIF